MATNKQLETTIAVHTEKLEQIEKDITEIKGDMKEHMAISGAASEKTNAKMDTLLYWFLGGMGTVILFLLGIMFK